tara:strand:- start:745 stop:1089 length:345 start_codon:yes stop_codon:yes gene_type:complete
MKKSRNIIIALAILLLLYYYGVFNPSSNRKKPRKTCGDFMCGGMGSPDNPAPVCPDGCTCGMSEDPMLPDAPRRCIDARTVTGLGTTWDDLANADPVYQQPLNQNELLTDPIYE